MISIIICSVNKLLLDQLKVNIGQTIGVEYEIIAIDNSIVNDGICKVYNAGGEKARYPLLCFVHEDVLFSTVNWGELISKHFNDGRTGLIGIAGGDTKGIVPSSWSGSFRSNEINIIQHQKKGGSVSRLVSTTYGEPESRKKVVALDGVFLCTKKDVFDKFRFDEDNLKGFHGYDIDYSLQVLSEYEVVVVFNILLHHYSEGSPDRKWVDNAIIVSNKWKAQLPVSVYPLSGNEFNYHHWKSLQVFIQKLFELDYSFFRIVYYYFRYSFNRFFRIRRFLSMGKYVLLSEWQRFAFVRNARTNSDRISDLKYDSR